MPVRRGEGKGPAVADEDKQHPGEFTAQQVADAKTLYAAYGETTGHKNFRGEPMPDWDGLGDTIQRAWVNAGAALRRVVERQRAEELGRARGSG